MIIPPDPPEGWTVECCEAAHDARVAWIKRQSNRIGTLWATADVAALVACCAVVVFVVMPWWMAVVLWVVLRVTWKLFDAIRDDLWAYDRLCTQWNLAHPQEAKLLTPVDAGAELMDMEQRWAEIMKEERSAESP